MAIGLDCPAVSRHAFLEQLIKDPKLPADTRLAVAPRCFPPKGRSSSRSGQAAVSVRKANRQDVAKLPAGKAAAVPIGDWTLEALDAPLGIVQDATVDANARRKAALKLAEFLLPKTPRKPRGLIDEYGFSVNPVHLNAYRDIRAKLRTFMKERQQTRETPAVARQIATLEARCDALLRRCQTPCPSKYSRDVAKRDVDRLMEFAEMRSDGPGLSEAEQVEEAYVRMRYRAYIAIGGNGVSPAQSVGGRGSGVQRAAC